MDLSQTIAPKSDHLNSDSLIAGPLTIAITSVTPRQDESRPVAINFEGDDGKPFLPCKAMRRGLVLAWGKDSTQYTGRGLILFRDPSVLYGGVAVGGVRISHASHLEKDLVFPLALNNKKKILWTFKVLKPWPPTSAPQQPPAREAARPARAAATQAQQQPAPDLFDQALARCRQAGLTDEGLAKFCDKLSQGTTKNLEKLPLNIIQAIVKNGIKPETVAECNG
jgi:hypothetical protein